MKIEGHMVVNHSYSHQPLASFSERALEKEIEDCDAVIADAVHMPSYKTQFFRSACGWRTPKLAHVLARLQKQLLPISDFGFDTNITRHTYPKWVDRTLQAARRDRGQQRLPGLGPRGGGNADSAMPSRGI
jgi:peptidoglycan/xylan/chitin deacetylase (PgdA/CDA1 family)